MFLRKKKKKNNAVQSRPPMVKKPKDAPSTSPSMKFSNNVVPSTSDELTSMKSAASESSSQLQLLTKKQHSFSRSGSSFSRSKKEKRMVTFNVGIHSLDGIISTRTGRQSIVGQLSQPLFAVISYQKKVMTTGSIVKTNIMSLPLVKSKSSIGNRERYYARFSDTEELQTFDLTAAMDIDPNSKSGFSTRELDLEISLMRGPDMLKIGATTMVLNGDEEGSMQLISVNAEKVVTNTLRKAMTANKPSRTSSSNITTTGAKSISFASDPTQKYTLQRSILRLSVSSNEDCSTMSSAYAKESPCAMMLALGHSDSISYLSSGGVTTQMQKNSEVRSVPKKEKGVEKLTSSKTETTEDFSNCNTETSSRSEDLTTASDANTQALRDLNGINCGHQGLRLLTSSGDYSSSDSDSDSNSDSEYYTTDGAESSRIPSFSYSEETESAVPFTCSEDSELLDQVSLGTIRFKEIDEGGGFEVKLKEGNKLKKTVSEILV